MIPSKIMITKILKSPKKTGSPSAIRHILRNMMDCEQYIEDPIPCSPSCVDHVEY